MLSPFVICLLAFVFSLFTAAVMLPLLIRFAESKNLFDNLSFRKSHSGKVPLFGGIAIFSGIMFAVLTLFGIEALKSFKYFLIGLSLTFLLGLGDDLVLWKPYQKFLSQLVVAIVVVVIGNFRLTSFYGLFGLYEMPLWVSYLTSVLLLILIQNAFNLIDGIDLLGAFMALLALLPLSAWFYLNHQLHYTILALASIGAILAFIPFNATPSRIFMGDAGTMTIGLILGILTIGFIQTQVTDANPWSIYNSPAVAYGFLAIPLGDVLRVFLIRILRKKSPFTADKNHIHHVFIRFGFSHLQASAFLFGSGTIIIVFNLLASKFGLETNILMLINILSILGVRWLPQRFKRNNMNK